MEWKSIEEVRSYGASIGKVRKSSDSESVEVKRFALIPSGFCFYERKYRWRTDNHGPY
jgi:hypothetical protein